MIHSLKTLSQKLTFQVSISLWKISIHSTNPFWLRKRCFAVQILLVGTLLKAQTHLRQTTFSSSLQLLSLQEILSVPLIHSVPTQAQKSLIHSHPGPVILSFQTRLLPVVVTSKKLIRSDTKWMPWETLIPLARLAQDTTHLEDQIFLQWVL